MNHPTLAVAHVHSGEVRECFNMSRLGLMIHETARSASDTGQAMTPFVIAEYCRTDGLVDARNQVAAGFLDHSPCDWLLCIDADMGFPYDAAERLLNSADPTERPVMGALCFAQKPIRSDRNNQARDFEVYPTVYEWHELPDQVGFLVKYDYPRDQVVQVSATGAAMVLIHRSVLEAIRARYGDTWFTKVRHPIPAPGGTEFGEDMSFFVKVQGCGFPVHVDTSVKTAHDKGGVFLTEEHYDRTRGVTGPATSEPISLLVPSRGRPGQLAAMIHTAYETAERPDLLEVVVRLDDDDPCDYPGLEDEAIVIRGPRGLLSAYWNECCAKAAGDILMHCGDDLRFRTPGWDTRVRRTFAQVPDRIVFVHGDDGYQHERLGTHGFLHRRWVETVGYFVPPKFSSDFNDTWLTEVADLIGRRVYLPDVVTEHLHPAAGKGEWDQTHQERLARHRDDRPDELYAATAAERLADAEKLKAVMR